MSQGSARGSFSPRYTRGVSICVSSPVGTSPADARHRRKARRWPTYAGGMHATGGGRRRTGRCRDPSLAVRRAVAAGVALPPWIDGSLGYADGIDEETGRC